MSDRCEPPSELRGDGGWHWVVPVRSIGGNMEARLAASGYSFVAHNNSNVAIVLHYGGEAYTVEPGQTLEVKP